MSDALSVCRTAYPIEAVRWTTSLIAKLPECTRSNSMRPADMAWERNGARFRTSTGAVISLPSAYTAGAREMYCRNVYLRTGLTMPTSGWVIDLGANHGLFSVWAAVTGAQVIAVEAQQGFAPLIQTLAEHNGVGERVFVETAMAGGITISGATVGVVADDSRWAATSHGAPTRPMEVSMPMLISKYGIDAIGLLKLDIEGGEFAVLAAEEDLSWLAQVKQIVLELHRDHGDVKALIDSLLNRGFDVELRDNRGERVNICDSHLAYAYGRR